MKEKLSKIKAAVDSLSAMLADCCEESESTEPEPKQNPFNDKDAGDGGQDIDEIMPQKKGGADKVKIASAIIKKKMGL